MEAKAQNSLASSNQPKLWRGNAGDIGMVRAALWHVISRGAHVGLLPFASTYELDACGF